MRRPSGRLATGTLVALATLASVALPRHSATVQAQETPGTVYTLTNDTAGNQVLAWNRAPSGALLPAGAYATAGQGSGDALGSQGALVLSADGGRLFAANAGSNDISVFAIRAERLTLAA